MLLVTSLSMKLGNPVIWVDLRMHGRARGSYADVKSILISISFPPPFSLLSSGI